MIGASVCKPRTLICTLVLWSLVTPLWAEDTPVATADDVMVIPLQDAIDKALLYVLRRAFREAQEAKVKAVIIDMQTPGGGLKETEEIITLIRACRNKGIPVYTFVNPSAISAGAITAMACEAIYMTPGATIGDAMPIIMTQEGPQEVTGGLREKIFSPTLAMVRALAQENGYSEEMAQSMVDPDYEFVIGDQVLCEEGKLLTLTAEEAAKIYPPMETPLLCQAVVKDISEVLEQIGLADNSVVRVEASKSEKIAKFLTSPIVTSIVMLCIIIGIYAEVQSPGIGFGAGIAVIGLIVFLFGHSVAGLTGKVDIILILVGIALLAAEVFVLPGFGICGLLGLLAVMAGLVMAMVPSIPQGNPLDGVEPSAVSEYIGEGVKRLAVALLLSIGCGLLLSRIFPHTGLYRRLALQNEALASEGYVGVDIEGQRAMIGKQGITQSPLRPAGIALIDGRRIDVVSAGSFVDGGVPVVVTETNGPRVVVEPVAADEPAEEKEQDASS